MLHFEHKKCTTIIHCLITKCIQHFYFWIKKHFYPYTGSCIGENWMFYEYLCGSGGRENKHKSVFSANSLRWGRGSGFDFHLWPARRALGISVWFLLCWKKFISRKIYKQVIMSSTQIWLYVSNKTKKNMNNFSLSYFYIKFK